MDEFIKITPAKKRLIEIISSLEVDEGLEIIPDRDGKPDSYFVKRTKKIVINSKKT